jgi:plasmid stabilization system protein ParE
MPSSSGSVSFSPEAEIDFASAIEYLAERNRAAATELGRRIFAVLDHLTRGEMEGPQQALRSGEVVRSWPVPPIRIYYQRRPDGLWVVRLYHQARRPITR